MSDHTQLDRLIARWREKANNQGAAVSGSLAKASVYRDCADELEEVIDDND